MRNPNNIVEAIKMSHKGVKETLKNLGDGFYDDFSLVDIYNLKHMYDVELKTSIIQTCVYSELVGKMPEGVKEYTTDLAILISKLNSRADGTILGE